MNVMAFYILVGITIAITSIFSGEKRAREILKYAFFYILCKSLVELQHINSNLNPANHNLEIMNVRDLARDET